MSKLCVFAGTTEGRALVEFLAGQPVEVTACVATEYGETLLPAADNLTVSAKRMTREEMRTMMEREGFDLVVDATHPYAAEVTENIAGACGDTGTEYLRLLREENTAPEGSVFVPDAGSAVDYLNTTRGNILLTTGSKELARYANIRDFGERVYARVLPMEESLQLCREARLAPAHIFAMQGPFSVEMNVAMLKAVSAAYLVTKESGSRGGFAEKVAAARAAGAVLVVIGRPAQRKGSSLSDALELVCRRFGLNRQPRVAVVGIGPGIRAAMTGEARAALEKADCVIGAKRMTEAVARPGQAVFHAIDPEAIAAHIAAHREHRSFAVVMSGDVGFFSGAKKLLPRLSNCRTEVLPGLSSLAYLCARLETSYEDVIPVSVHGRDHNIVPDIRANARVFALVGGEDGMTRLCRTLTDAGLGDVRVSVGEKLSYPDEKITVGTAEALSEQSFETLSVALIENRGAKHIVTHGLPDTAFQRGGSEDGVVPMTKSEVRAVCLSKLQLTADSVCWDVGAGTGSVAIEMALQARKGRVYAIERKDAAVALLRENKTRFAAENLIVVSGCAPEACQDLPAPTHAFIGGTSGNMKDIVALLLKKNPGVRIVATAISLESVAELTDCVRAFPFSEHEVISVTVARGRTAGSYHLMTGQNPIYIFTMQAGGNGK